MRERILEGFVALIIMVGMVASAFASPADCVTRTRTSGHVLVPSGAWSGDPIHVEAISPGGECVGQGTITSAPSVVTMWGWDEYVKQGLMPGDEIQLATGDGALAVRLGGDERWYVRDLRWEANMLAIATQVAPADSLFDALDSLAAVIDGISNRRDSLEAALLLQSSRIDSLGGVVSDLTLAREALREEAETLSIRASELEWVVQQALTRIRSFLTQLR